MSLIYRQSGLKLSRGTAAPVDLVRALQTDLRRLGYLRSGLDGGFGPGTEQAVRALEYDLRFGDSRDGTSVAIRNFNRGRITSVTGVLDENLAACLEDILTDPGIPALPSSADPVAANRSVLATIRTLDHPGVPVPFLLAILSQESGLQHFRVPTAANPDNFIVVGLDRGDRDNPDRITSRGYGVGQFTLFHHPPTRDEVTAVMLDPVKNVERALHELQDKYTHFVAGPPGGRQADDRLAAVGPIPLRPCRYAPDDPRYQTDCRQCAMAAPRMNLAADAPVYENSPLRLSPTQYHSETHYDDLPDWKTFGCDWPYAVRRYNGSGMDSYHYQAEVLGRFLGDRVLAALLDPRVKDVAGTPEAGRSISI